MAIIIATFIKIHDSSRREMKLDKFSPIMENVIRNRNLFLIEMRIIDAQLP